MLLGLCLAFAACGGKSTIGWGESESSGTPSVAPLALETCGHVPCGVDESCCLTTLECFDPVAHPEACPVPSADEVRHFENPEEGAPCASNAHCAVDEVCLPANQTCAGAGHCYPQVPCEARNDGQGVCGCDGKNHACFYGPGWIGNMKLVGTFVGCGETEVGTDWTACGSDADCTREGEACCGATGSCYAASDPGQCAIPPPFTSYPCTSNAQCGDLEYCAGIGCGTPGGCVMRTESADDCGHLTDTVCGCDGLSYTSPACAAKWGTRVASKGECP